MVSGFEVQSFRMPRFQVEGFMLSGSRGFRFRVSGFKGIHGFRVFQGFMVSGLGVEP